MRDYGLLLLFAGAAACAPRTAQAEEPVEPPAEAATNEETPEEQMAEDAVLNELAVLPVMVSEGGFNSEDEYDIINSNISVVNALREDGLLDSEIPPDANRSYMVDYYLAQVNNGGFSQFVYNSRFNAQVVQLVESGLEAMGATRHLELFRQLVADVESLSEHELTRFLESGYFGGENAERSALDTRTMEFYAINREESLITLNSQWLRGLPGLTVRTIPEMEAEIARRLSMVPADEMARRRAEALANAPRYMRVAIALAESEGLEFEYLTAGDPTFEFEGEHALAWHFFASGRHLFHVDLGGRVLLYDGTTDELIRETTFEGE